MKKSDTPKSGITPVHYLPRTLVEYWSVHPDNDSPIWGRWLTGSLMHCDITGFTAMSEALGELGKEGAEFMAAILNRFFERMLGIAEHWDGVQMKFGGDAMLLLFSGKDHARDAAMCATQMQHAMDEFRRVTVLDTQHPLKMRIGIHSGHFYSASVGKSDGHLHYLLFGVDVNKTALVEPNASPGQVVTSDETAELIRDGFTIVPTRVLGIWRVKSTDENYQHGDVSKPDIVLKNILQRYLLPPLAKGQVANLGGEHRRVTAVFINVLGAADILTKESEQEALRQTNTYLVTLIDAIEKYGGYLAASDVAEVGEKLLILFGAPVSLDRQEEKALLFIDEFNQRLKQANSRLSHKVGVNSGFVFAGEIGSPTRKEYTVIGDSVNLAARLMGKASPGDTVISAITARRSGELFQLKKKRSIRVKGKTEPIPIFQFLGSKEQSVGFVESKEFFTGRKKELQKIRKLLASIKKGGFGVVHIGGEPGVGKTALSREVLYSLKPEGWVTLEGHGQSYLASTPFSIWRQPLKALFSILPDDNDAEALERIRLVMSDLVPQYKDFYLLVAEILAIKFQNDEIMDALDARERHEKRLEIIPGLFSGLSTFLPLVIYIDNYQWIDESSRELLEIIVKQKPENVLIFISSRLGDLAFSANTKQSIEQITLQDLSEEDAKEVVRYYAISDDASRISEIVAKAKGNPLFLRELASASQQGGGELPATINDVIMVKVDNLDQRSKSTLRLAAVIGNEFEKDTLVGLLEAHYVEQYLTVDIQTLIDAGFLKSLDEEKRFQFANNLTWEVVYETLLYADRREIHKRVVQYLENRFAENLSTKAGALAYHNERAGDAEKAMFHTAVAGDNAARLFAINDAMNYYQEALSFLDKLKDKNRVERSAIQEKIGDVFLLAGRAGEAIEEFNKGLKIWRSSSRRTKLRGLPWKIKGTEQESILCRKLSDAFCGQSDYETALKWADEALEVLPARATNVKSQIYLAKSGTLFRKGDLKESASWAEKAKVLAKKLNRSQEIANSSKLIANVYMWEGRFADAINELEDSSAIYQGLNNLPGIASTNGNLGVCYQLQGELDSASRHYSEALKAYSQLQNQPQIAAVSNNQGEVLLTRGDIDGAISNLEQTVNICLEKNSEIPLAGLALVNLCRCSELKEDFPAAERYLRKGIRLLKAAGAEQLLNEARLQKVELDLKQGHVESAEKNNRRLLKELAALDLKVLVARSHRLQALLLAQQDKLDQAKKEIDKSIAIAEQIDARHELARAFLAQANILLQSGDKLSSNTADNLNKAIELFSAMGATPEAQAASQLLQSH